MKPYKPLDPGALMTRADLVMDILAMLEETLEIIKRNPSGTVQERGTQAEVEATIYVLQKMFPVSELMAVDSYDYLKKTVDAVPLLHKRYEQNCRLIKECPSFSPADVEKKLTDMKTWYDEELETLDRSADANK